MLNTNIKFDTIRKAARKWLWLLTGEDEKIKMASEENRYINNNRNNRSQEGRNRKIINVKKCIAEHSYAFFPSSYNQIRHNQAENC